VEIAETGFDLCKADAWFSFLYIKCVRLKNGTKVEYTVRNTNLSRLIKIGLQNKNLRISRVSSIDRTDSFRSSKYLLLFLFENYSLRHSLQHFSYRKPSYSLDVKVNLENLPSF